MSKLPDGPIVSLHQTNGEKIACPLCGTPERTLWKNASNQATGWACWECCTNWMPLPDPPNADPAED